MSNEVARALASKTSQNFRDELKSKERVEFYLTVKFYETASPMDCLLFLMEHASHNTVMEGTTYAVLGSVKPGRIEAMAMSPSVERLYLRGVDDDIPVGCSLQFWSQSPHFPAFAAQQIKDRSFVDYGGSTGELAAAILAKGESPAALVVDWVKYHDEKIPGVEFNNSSFEKLSKDPMFLDRVTGQPAVLSWPPKTGSTAWLVPLLERAPEVVYLGQSMRDQVACPELWRHLCFREILEVRKMGIGSTRSLAICYGAGRRRGDEPLLWEEIFGLVIPSILFRVHALQENYREIYSPVLLRNLSEFMDEIFDCYCGWDRFRTLDKEEFDRLFDKISMTLDSRQREKFREHVENCEAAGMSEKALAPARKFLLD